MLEFERVAAFMLAGRSTLRLVTATAATASAASAAARTARPIALHPRGLLGAALGDTAVLGIHQIAIRDIAIGLRRGVTRHVRA